MKIIDKPIIIIGAPRSGTTLLFRCLALHTDLWHLEGESHVILEKFFHPEENGYKSNRCTDQDLASEEVSREICQQFYDRALNLNKVFDSPSHLLTSRSLLERLVSQLTIKTVGRFSQTQKPNVIRFLEKTPKNTLRISLLNRLFPDALFIWNKRQANRNIDSLISGWFASDQIGSLKIERFSRSGYPIADRLQLKDYSGKWWKFALVPDWQSLQGQSVADVAAWQYFQCNRLAMIDLAEISQERVFSLKHEDFISNPVNWIRSIFEWSGLPQDMNVENFAEHLPRINDVPFHGRVGQNLRYQNEVEAAIDRNPDLMALQKAMGYSNE